LSRQSGVVYKYFANRFVEWLARRGVDPAAASEDEIARFVEESYANEFTRIVALYGIRAMYLERYNRLVDVTNMIKRYPSLYRLQTYIPSDVIADVALKAQPMHGSMVALIYEFALRAGEVGLLEVGDIDLARKRVIVKRENGMITELPIEDGWVYETLVRYLSQMPPHRYLYPSRKGGGYKHDTVWKIVKTTFKERGVDATPKTLRFSRMADLIIRGVSISDFMMWAGIKSQANATRIYETIFETLIPAIR